MLDIKFIRQNPEKAKEACRKKQVKCDIDRLLEVDTKRLEHLRALEDMRSQKNKTSKIISKIDSEKEKRKLILEMRELDRNNDRLDLSAKKLEEEFNNLMRQIPNPPLQEVPFGKSGQENVEIKKEGDIPKFDFKAKDYMELGERLDIIDTKRAAKVAGTRFGYLKGEAVLLEFALVNLALDTLTKEGFVPVVPPVMMKEEMAQGTGYFEAIDKEEAYFIPDDKLFLAGTSEQSLISMHSEEILEEKSLPKRYLGFSTCFRREAGAYGKDTKGILRVHQFDKVEMVSFSKPEDSKKEHEFLLAMEEKLMKTLKIPYRVLRICTGDLGRPAAAKYDIEAWLPSEDRYRETHSASNCTDFQARRLNIRYRDSKTKKLEFVHTLNGTAFAIGRTLITIMENYQQKDGTIKIPDILKKYIGKEFIG